MSARPGRRRLAAAGVVLLAVAVIALTVRFAITAPSGDGAVVRDTPAPNARAEPVPTAVPAAPSPVLPSATPPARRIAVCGMGIFDAPDDTYQPPRPVMERARASTALAATVAHLGASARADDRAIALRYQAAMVANQAVDAAEVSRPGCTNDSACNAAAYESGGLLAQPYLIALAQLADQSDDPLALTMAWRACNGPLRGNDLCSRITLPRLAARDPDNALPWLMIAAEAGSRGDLGAQGEAMRRAAASRRMDPYIQQTLRPIGDEMLAKAAPIDRAVAQGTAIGLYAAEPIVQFSSVFEYCKRADARERVETCAPLATFLVERDPTLMGISIGRGIGALAGWPAERLAAVDDQIDAMKWMGEQMGEEYIRDLEGGTSLTCAGMAQQERRAMELMRFGEAGSLRRRIAATKRPVSELAKAYRAGRGERK